MTTGATPQERLEWQSIFEGVQPQVKWKTVRYGKAHKAWVNKHFPKMTKAQLKACREWVRKSQREHP